MWPENRARTPSIFPATPSLCCLLYAYGPVMNSRAGDPAETAAGPDTPFDSSNSRIRRPHGPHSTACRPRTPGKRQRPRSASKRNQYDPTRGHTSRPHPEHVSFGVSYGPPTVCPSTFLAILPDLLPSHEPKQLLTRMPPTRSQPVHLLGLTWAKRNKLQPALDDITLIVSHHSTSGRSERPSAKGSDATRPSTSSVLPKANPQPYARRKRGLSAQSLIS